MSRRRITIREARFLANARSLYDIETYSTDEVREIVKILDAADERRDRNIETARTEARAALDFRIHNGY